jgi:hypothetical protein
MEAWVGDMAALCPRMRRVFRMLDEAGVVVVMANGVCVLERAA